MAKAIVSTVRPNASATPSRPMVILGNAAAKTALPHPPRTSQKVPTNSAPYFYILLFFALLIGVPNCAYMVSARKPISGIGSVQPPGS